MSTHLNPSSETSIFDYSFWYSLVTFETPVYSFIEQLQKGHPDIRSIESKSNAYFLKELEIVFLGDIHTMDAVVKCNRAAYEALRKPESPLYVEADAASPQAIQDTVDYQLGIKEPSEHHHGWDLDVDKTFLYPYRYFLVHIRDLVRAFKAYVEEGSSNRESLQQAVQTFITNLESDAQINSLVSSEEKIMGVLNRLRMILGTNSANFAQQVYERIEEIFARLSVGIEEICLQSLPSRQKLMVEVLQKAILQQRQSKQKAPIFVVAGRSHFVGQQGSNKSEDFDDTKMDPILQQFLENQKVQYLFLYTFSYNEKRRTVGKERDIHLMRDEIHESMDFIFPRLNLSSKTASSLDQPS